MDNELKISIPIATYKKQAYWIAFCPALKTFGYSNESEEKALEDFDRAIETFFYVQGTLGCLGSVLQNLGWSRADANSLEQPKYFNTDMQNIFPGGHKKERQIKVPA